MSQLTDALDTLGQNLAKDELSVVLPLADAYFGAIEANPAPDNVVAQSLKLEADVLAALPNIEATAAKDVATALKLLMDTQAAALASSAAPADTSTVVSGTTD